MPPKQLTHHEINACRDAVLNVLDRRKTQLEALKSRDDEVLNDLYQENDVPCEDDAGNADFTIAIENLYWAMDRLDNLEARLAEILQYCERCGARDDTVSPVYPSTVWLCDVCDERA
jgi:hypothetical protein